MGQALGGRVEAGTDPSGDIARFQLRQHHLVGDAVQLGLPEIAVLEMLGAGVHRELPMLEVAGIEVQEDDQHIVGIRR